ncbi:hypothetical protein [Nocardioides sp. AX2bis]|uniref:hypothetical protein n=1 Tax=Nocardioides sp. AX2bis TaxID=2653157 RepID=UPI001357CBA1|nr:hypothetical protein [Nocardioides sp. AX2bis]
MPDPDEVAPRRPLPAWTTTPVPLVAAALAVVVAAVGGAVVGTTLPWGDVPLTVESGTVLLQEPANGLASFEGDDGTVLGLDADALVWSAGSEHGEGTPPCLREGREVAVELGYRWVRLPDGGSSLTPVWMGC